MENKQRSLLTIGEFASKAGITLRTLRYYDKIGLLKPTNYNEAGHRFYSKEDFAKLQKILTLKFIGLSLEDISNIIRYDIKEKDFKKSLEIQKSIIEDKINHMHMIVNSIDETLHMIENENILRWGNFINIINVVNMDKKWIEQYENSSNLRARIAIHELFSTNEYGWMRWFFEQMNISENARILELGCGDASLWVKNLDRIPEGWEITLTDFSQGMIKDTKNALGENQQRFKFKLADAQDIPFEDFSFDVVIANHMLYHVADVEKALSEINRVLKPGGCFYASTVGKNHMKELRDIIYNFDSKIITTKSWELTEKFHLENGSEQVVKWFKNVNIKRYEDSLKITEALPLINYIFSMPGNFKDSFDEVKLVQLISFIEDIINKTGSIFITKDTGFFEARKYNNLR